MELGMAIAVVVLFRVDLSKPGFSLAPYALPAIVMVQ